MQSIRTKKKRKAKKKKPYFAVVDVGWYSVSESEVNDEDLVRYWKAAE